MKYVSTATWCDLEDKHLYHDGDEFPFDGREIPEARLSELSCPQNKAGFAVIKAVEVPNEGEPVEDEGEDASKEEKNGENAVESENEGKPVVEAKPHKKTTRGRKKA